MEAEIPCSCGAMMLWGGSAGWYCELGFKCPDLDDVFAPYRPSWDEWALGLAKGVALRGDCRRRQVGSVLLRPDHTVVSVGYNGVAPGEAGCLEGACPRGLLSTSEIPPDSSYDTGPGMCISSHSESNCLANARENTAGYTLYCTDKPCTGCMRTIKAHRLARVVWPGGECLL